MIGKTISHYRIVEKLGEGGMGVVYKAEDTKLKRTVALKFLPPELTRDEKARERFVHEARAASAVDHPNICTIHEIDETTDGRTFIAMACYEGESLRAKIERGPLPLDEAIDIASQVAQGLAKAHERKIIHRDIKPANVLITRDGLVKIVDFGLAKLSGVTRLTKTGMTPGTVSYMSPEQLRGGKVDERSDIWALGVVMYEMVTGETPFRGEYEQAVGYSIMNEAPKPMRSLRPEAPGELERVVEKALSKDVGRRYRTLTELLGALQSVKGRSGSGAPDTGLKDEDTIPSIAVLPFTNMSTDPENQYFGDGLAEELINALAQIKDLRVAARTSAFHFRGENIDIREIGEKLSVQTVLEGSVRKAGNRLRITAQLINIENGYHIWSKRFDSEMRDIFDIQDEITRAIVDPSFALVHGWLSAYYGSRSFWGNEAPGDLLPKSRAAAEKALELDDTVAVAHAQLANVLWLFERNLVAAEREFKRTLELDPGSGSALGRITYALFLALRGRKEEAVREAQRSLKLDPLSGLVAAWAGGTLTCVGEAREAMDIIRKAIALDPGHWQLYWQLGLAYFVASMENEAVAACEKSVDLSGGASAALALLAAVDYLTGKSSEADKLVERLNERSKQMYVPQSFFAWICVAREERKAALAHMERAVQERDSWLDFNAVMPPQIRLGGAEMDALLAKAGLRRDVP